VAVPLEVAVAVDVEVALDVDELPVGDVDVPSVGSTFPLPAGALALAPPTLITVEMPPLARTLTFVETIVVEVEDCPDAFDEAGVAPEPAVIVGLAAGSWAITGEEDAAGPDSLELEP
jgi:hypothetical protein